MVLRHFALGATGAIAVTALLALFICGIGWLFFVGQRVNVTFRDCGWSAKAQAFVDENANGVRDVSEPGLPEVGFLIDDTRNKLTKVGARATNDQQGNADLFVWLPGCPDVEFEVYALPPSGYAPTTPSRLPDASTKDGEPFVFGFTQQK